MWFIKNPMRSVSLPILIFLGLGLNAQVTFSRVPAMKGLDYKGRTYGSSWGDINGDGLMDLYLSCHQNKAEPVFENDSIRILINRANGSFNLNILTLDDGGQSDAHGGAFFDYDNDGDQDLMILTGGTKRNIFLRNDGNSNLMDYAAELNVALDLGRGRQSTCVDLNNDGFTDLIINNEEVRAPGQIETSAMLSDGNGTFDFVEDNGMHDPYSVCSYISDMNGNSKTDVIVANRDSIKIYSLSPSGQFQLRTLIETSNLRDLSVADFNGDLLPDLFLARGLKTGTDVTLFNENTIHAMSRVSIPRPSSGATFRTQGSIQEKILDDDLAYYTLHVGQNLIVDSLFFTQEFNLNPAFGQVQGFQNPVPTSAEKHVYIGLLPDGSWRFELESFNSVGSIIGLEVISQNPITEFQPFGMKLPNAGHIDQLLINQGNYTFVASQDPVFSLQEFSLNSTCGDYDNDRDVDIYVQCSGQAKNRPDYMYENNGDGTFIRHENPWGVRGDAPGIGDAVSTADMDNDGFLDLLLTNGSLVFFLDSAELGLYRNEGNANHWFMIDLEGVVSNRDGFGARVILKADNKNQLRDMTGGIHTSCQDDARLHFGLGNAQLVQTIHVYWPSGAVDVLENQAIDQILTIVEGQHRQDFNPFDIEIFDLFPEGLDNSISGRLSQGDISAIVVFNALGQELKTISPRDFDQADPLGHLPAGLYILGMRDQNGQITETVKWMHQ